MPATLPHRFGRMAPVIVLLLVLFFIRTHHIDVQNPYVDEGFHIKRAGLVWDFDVNPGRFAHGKVLLYFWLGLFETGPETALPASRLGMGIYALITGSTIYLLGRLLYRHAAGLLALALYTVLPLALFYERMAMADPLAAGLAALIAWRGLAFACRPGLWRGVELGVLLALATLAKLTMGLMPLLPGIAALLYYPWRRGAVWPQMLQFIQTYAPPLVVATITVGLMWAPLAVPAFFARNSDEPFVLVDPFNVRSSADEPASPFQYLSETLPLVYEVTTRWLIFALVAAAIYMLLALAWDRPFARNSAYILAWFLLIAGLTLVGARLSTLRYVMPLGVPAVLLLAGAASSLWCVPVPYVRPLLRLALTVALVAWVVGFALPFIRTNLTDPDDLDFSSTNWTEYQSGYLIADDAVRDAAAALNAIEPHPKPVYATWWLCHLMYFYADDPLTCLDYSHPVGDLAPALEAELGPDQVAYVASAGYQPFLSRIPGLCAEPIGVFDRPKIRSTAWDVSLWRVWWGC